MPSIISLTALAALAGLFNLASAGTEVKLNAGVCRTLPGAIGLQDKGSFMVGDVSLYAAGTGTALDNLGPHWGSIREVARGEPAWETLALYNETGYARYLIGCQDDTGLATFLGGTKTFRINTDKDSTLVVGNFGLMPEPYSYFVDGAKQTGVYFGAAGEIRWAFSNATSNGIAFWKPRLLIATVSDPKGAELRAGEVQGFLVAK